MTGNEISTAGNISALIITLMTWMAVPIASQNLVPNPGFEEIGSCPSQFGMGGALLAPPWINGSGTTADILNACATSAFVDVPDNYFGWQPAHTGDGYAGAYHKAAGYSWHEYLQVQLTSPLIADEFYHVGMYVNLANYYCGIQNVGLYISNTQPIDNSSGEIFADPQIYWEGGYLTDTANWTKIDAYYLAQGGEQWITIGNFETEENSQTDPSCWITFMPEAYYHFDDVWVIAEEPCEELDLDLGDDVEACFEYTIDPELGDLHYVWSTGSTDPTITVYESGVYGLTITDTCRVGYDEIEVIILGTIPVAIEPDSVTFCPGESYEIDLDDQYGEYVWQDGSTDAQYVIESSGVYSVTYDDGCAVSADTIMVHVLDPPAQFTLGDDALLCDGDDLTISFDESLGEFEWSDGSDESSFTIDEAGIYALTISNDCGEASDEMEVSEDESPVVEFGPDEISICNGETITYEFDEDEGSYMWQDSSTDNLIEITLPGLYSVTVTNGCDSYDDQILVTVSQGPEVDLGADITTCAAQLPDTLEVLGSGITSIMWQDGSSLTQLIVTTSGLYSVTATNACGSRSDTIQVVVANVLPTVTLPDDMIGCEGDSIWLFSTGDEGAYLWQDGTVDDSLLVQNSGQYILQVSTICGVGSDSVDIQFNPDSLFPNLGPDIALCPGNSVILSAGNTFDTYLWQDLSTADTLVVSSAGMYSVSVSDECGTGTDTVLVSANGAPPQLNLVDSVPLCAGAQLILDAGIGGVNYLWNDGTGLSTLNVNTPGAYSLTVSNNCGSDIDTVLVVDGGALPVIELGNDIQLCEGESQLIAPDLTTADSWMWQDGSSGPTMLVNSEGQISIEVSNACGQSYDTLFATILQAIPPINLGNDTALCSSDMLLLQVNIPDVSITWFDGSHDDQITITESGTYSVEIANACGVSADTLIVAALPDLPDISLGPDQFLCPGEVITFDPSIPGVEYVWHDGTTAATFSTTQPGLIILTISNVCGTSTDSLLIEESTEGPQLDLGPDVNACIGDTVTIQAGIGGVVYIWQDGSTNPFYQTSVDIQLILHISNACGEDVDSIAVQFSELPAPELGPDTLLCEGEVITLTSDVDPETTITWQDGSHASDFVVTTSGVYFLQLSNDCGVKTDSIVISYKSTPAPFSLGPDIIICEGEAAILQAPVTTDQLQWQDGSNSTMITANVAQQYSLTISNECGIAFDDIKVGIDSNIPDVQLDSMFMCPGEQLTLDATQPFAAQYIWSTGATNSSIEILSPGEYTITVTTECFEITDVVRVDPSDDCEEPTHFFIPNIFSPNGDEVNDEFGIYFNEDAEVISVMGEIFDRWGNKVFGSQQYPFTWDGNMNGKPMNPGVYVYHFTLVYSNGMLVVTEQVTGDVTLIK